MRPKCYGLNGDKTQTNTATYILFPYVQAAQLFVLSDVAEIFTYDA